MLKFIISESDVVLTYASDHLRNRWVFDKLRESGYVTLSRVFTFKLNDLIDGPNKYDDINNTSESVYSFRFAARIDGYFYIEGRIFNIENLVLIADKGLILERKVFVAERKISIFRRISTLISSTQPIIIGGNKAGAIPIQDFQALIDKFPNTGELDRYAAARVENIIGDYIMPLKDARTQYEAYLNRRRSTLGNAIIDQSELMHTEINKYEYIRKTINEWLSKTDARSEKDWQNMILNFILLIFPRYIAVLSNIKIHDYYSNSEKTKYRYIDLALIDASGNIDIIEIKKPFDDALMARSMYRDNYIPSKELSGSIMQAEKYLFHLSKWGLTGEKTLTKLYAPKLPSGMEIRITNPKAMIILGRDRQSNGSSALSQSQQLDLEIIKRKYANMIDILTYDDLLRRLDNIIVSLQSRPWRRHQATPDEIT